MPKLQFIKRCLLSIVCECNCKIQSDTTGTCKYSMKLALHSSHYAASQVVDTHYEVHPNFQVRRSVLGMKGLVLY